MFVCFFSGWDVFFELLSRFGMWRGAVYPENHPVSPPKWINKWTQRMGFSIVWGLAPSALAQMMGLHDPRLTERLLDELEKHLLQVLRSAQPEDFKGRGAWG